MKRRVVITACSAITPIGYQKNDIIHSLRQGKSGVAFLRDDGLLSKHIHSRVFGTVDYPIDYGFKRQYRKTMGPVAYYACQVAKDVLESSGLSQEFTTSGRLGVAFGSTHGSPTVQREIYKTFFSDLESKFSSIGAVDYLRSMVHPTAVLLEGYESAKKRGADILGEIIGFACNNNGGDLILPNFDGITATLRLALKDAGILAKDVDFVSAHATATKMGDVIEAQAIDAVYGDDPLNRPLVTGLKSYMGHTMGTCGVIETILTLYMMKQGFIAPTLNLENVDERCSMLRHTRELTETETKIAAIQNFAFGGVNTCLLVKNGRDAEL